MSESGSGGLMGLEGSWKGSGCALCCLLCRALELKMAAPQRCDVIGY